MSSRLGWETRGSTPTHCPWGQAPDVGVPRPTGQVCRCVVTALGWSGAQPWGAAEVIVLPVHPATLLLTTATWGLQISMAPHSAVPEQTTGPTVATRGDPTAVTPMEMPLHPDSLEAAPRQEGGPPASTRWTQEGPTAVEGEFV